MSSTPISKDIALRIALAARLLPDNDPARLLKVLDDAVGLPPTAKKLERLRLRAFKAAGDGGFANIDDEVLKKVIEILTGNDASIATDLDLEFDSYTEGDMPGSLRIACASNSAEEMDGHFGSCKRFLIYQVNEKEIRLLESRKADGPESRDDKNIYRAELINDCQILFVASIGGPAAAKVVKAGVHPVKYPLGGNARECLMELQKTISVAPPPWLAKVMGQNAESRVRFERTKAEG